MKFILFILSSFFILTSHAQITILGAKKTEIIETNNDKKEIKEIKNLNFTKSQEETIKPTFIFKNTIENSTTKLVGETVEINIIEPNEITGNTKNQIVVDLDKAKKATDSVKYFNNPDYAFEDQNNSISEPEFETKTDFDVTKNSIGLNSTTSNFDNTNLSEENNTINTPIVSKTNFKEEINQFEEVDTELEFETNKIEKKNESGIHFEPTNDVKRNTKPFESEINSETISEEPIGNMNNLNTIEPASISSSNSVDNSSETDLNDDSPNPKKGSWSLGLKAGIPAIIGDINSRAGYGFSLNIQKAIGHVFALRFEALALETKGLNNRSINNTYHNYKTRFTDYTLQGVFTLNNLNFYKKEPKVLYNIAVGGGIATRYTWTDLVNENGVGYNYDNISVNNPSGIYKELNSIRDKNYETSIPKDEDKMSIKNTNILPTIMLGLGVDIKLSEKFDLNLASRFSYHFDDNLDGLKLGNNSDWMTFTSLGLTYKFGSKSKSMLWTNPVYSKIEEINDLKKKVDEGDLLKDEDKDGIADIFDQDLNTPAKVAVDSRGIASDMDKDGVPDYEDSEPFTPLGAQVDSRGVALDTDNDGIADIVDQENNTLAGSQVDSRGKTIIPARNEANDLAALKSNSDFDLVFFAENSSNVKKEFYSDLYKISRYIQANPTAKIEIIGHTDVLAGEDFNLNLSEKRANAVYSMLIEMFKVPSRNLSTNFKGEYEPLIDGLPDRKDRKFDAAYYINRRVEFKIIQ